MAGILDPAMLRITELKLPLDHPDEALREAIVQRLGIRDEQLLSFNLFKRSYDARKKNSELLFIYTIDLEASNEAELLSKFADDRNISVARTSPTSSSARPRPTCRSARSWSVSARAASLPACCWHRWASSRSSSNAARKCASAPRTPGACGASVLNPESNVQFGEGGAGTFSDGKLYSQIKDPQHHGRKVLEEFVKAGAPDEILYVSKPHIGTFRLTGMVEQMRQR
jgi:uncharacterized FAD-dependent dehydrogenase